MRARYRRDVPVAAFARESVHANAYVVRSLAGSSCLPDDELPVGLTEYVQYKEMRAYDKDFTLAQRQ